VGNLHCSQSYWARRNDVSVEKYLLRLNSHSAAFHRFYMDAFCGGYLQKLVRLDRISVDFYIFIAAICAYPFSINPNHDLSSIKSNYAFRIALFWAKVYP
jgi:hypothetical protein